MRILSTLSTHRLQRRAALAACVSLAALLPSVASAQGVIEEITVSARRREESLIAAPLSVTAFTAATLEKAQIRDLTEFNGRTPGFRYATQSIAQSSRVAPQVRFRGMNAGAVGQLLQIGSSFLDGTFLLGGAQSLTFEDIERIEVIKGPQSALFGRGTFGGAVNFVTKRPGDTYGGTVTAEVETRSSHRISGAVDLPIMEKVKLRVSGAAIQKGAHYHNLDGTDIGRERTENGNIQAVITPSDNLELRVRHVRSYQHDSQGAVVSLSASRVEVTSPVECQPGTVPYWCGAIPLLGDAGVPSRIASNAGTLLSQAFAKTTNPTLIADILAKNRNNPLFKPIGDNMQDQVPTLNHNGSEGRVQRSSVEGTYTFGGGYKLDASFSTSSARSMYASATNDDGKSWVFAPLVLTNRNVEARFSSPGEQRLRWSLGVNHFSAEELGSSAGIASASAIGGVASYNPPAILTGQYRNVNTGGFGTLSYDILQNLTLDLEGRYQSDSLISGYKSLTPAELADKAFLPRVILNYHPIENTTLYGSWSKGKLPGAINAFYDGLFPAVQNTINSQPGFSRNVPPETLNSYEIGFKHHGSWFEYSIAAYYMKWNNLKNTAPYIVNCNTPGVIVLSGTCNTGSFQVGPNTISIGTLNPIFARNTKIKGLEFEGTVAVTENLSLGLSLDLPDAKYDAYLLGSAAVAATGLTTANGKTIYEYPTNQGSLAATWDAPLVGEWRYHVRGDLVHIGKIYVDEAALAYVRARNLVNLRAGIESEKGMKFEIYATNLLGDKNWASGRRGTDTLNGVGPSAFVELPRKQAFGLRAGYTF